jgi:anti-sigma regulatory factor (Ser/Thr protein kinase)
VPLNRPALTLGSGPRGVHDARRWVVRTCADIGRDDLTECAELGVSELVTNALLHGEPPISVRVRGTVEHPRIEVRDSSLEAPVLPTASEMDEHDELLLTYGRGLTLVARSADAWGAEIEDDGKVVWFAPAGQFAEHEGVPGLITGVDAVRARREPTQDRVRVEILGVPLTLFIGFQQHFRELRREVRLLSLAHERDYPLAKSLSDLFATLDRHLREGIGVEQIEAAVAARRTRTDLVVHMPRATARTLSRFIELLDLADDFCRQQRLLSLARTPEQRRFQGWFLCEFVRQAQGEDPVSWADIERSQQTAVS